MARLQRFGINIDINVEELDEREPSALHICGFSFFFFFIEAYIFCKFSDLWYLWFVGIHINVQQLSKCICNFFFEKDIEMAVCNFMQIQLVFRSGDFSIFGCEINSSVTFFSWIFNENNIGYYHQQSLISTNFHKTSFRKFIMSLLKNIYLWFLTQ